MTGTAETTETTEPTHEQEQPGPARPKRPDVSGMAGGRGGRRSRAERIAAAQGRGSATTPSQAATGGGDSVNAAEHQAVAHGPTAPAPRNTVESPAATPETATAPGSPSGQPGQVRPTADAGTAAVASQPPAPPDLTPDHSTGSSGAEPQASRPEGGSPSAVAVTTETQDQRIGSAGSVPPSPPATTATPAASPETTGSSVAGTPAPVAVGHVEGEPAGGQELADAQVDTVDLDADEDWAEQEDDEEPDELPAFTGGKVTLQTYVPDVLATKFQQMQTTGRTAEVIVLTAVRNCAERLPRLIEAARGPVHTTGLFAGLEILEKAKPGRQAKPKPNSSRVQYQVRPQFLPDLMQIAKKHKLKLSVLIRLALGDFFDVSVRIGRTRR
jgi:hypothetical protein